MLNSERMVKVGDTRPSLYHSFPFDFTWFSYSILEFEMYNKFLDPAKSQYFSLKESGDSIGFQFGFVASAITSLTLEMRSCAGVITAVNPSLYLKQFTVIGNKNKDGVQLKTAQYNFKVSDVISTATGKYNLLLTVTFTDTTVVQYISEPILVATTHPNTVLVEYSNSTNNYDTIFTKFPPKFNIRIDGWMKYRTNNIDREMFRNQNAELRGLYARDWRLFDVVFGGRNGIAPYHLEKLIKANKCDSFSIDGQRILADEGADFEATDLASFYPLKQLKYQAVEYAPADSVSYFETLAIPIMPLGALTGFPYVVDILVLAGSSIGNFLYDYTNEIRDVYDAADETAFIAELNAKVPAFSATGVFSVDANRLFYVPGSPDVYTAALVSQLTNPLKTAFTTTLSYLTLGVNLNQMPGVNTIVSVRTAAGAIVLPAEHKNGLTDSYTATVPTAAAHIFYLYSNNKVTEIQMDGHPTGKIITGFTGTPPTKLQIFRVRGGNITSFPLAFLRPCAPELRVLNVQFFNVDAFVTTDFAVVNPGDWQYFNYLYLLNNSLDATAQDAVFNDYQTYILYTYFGLSGPVGIIDTRNQSPSSAPTGASSLARINEAAVGYTILF